jgi:hypothetical protein
MVHIGCASARSSFGRVAQAVHSPPGFEAPAHRIYVHNAGEWGHCAPVQKKKSEQSNNKYLAETFAVSHMHAVSHIY